MKLGFLTAALIALAAPACAQASTEVITVNGVVSSAAYDYSGLFGEVGKSLAGQEYQLEYRFETPTAIYVPGISNFSSSAEQPMTSSIVINGASRQIASSTFSYVERADQTGGHLFFVSMMESPSIRSFASTDIYSHVNEFMPSDDLTAPMDYTLTSSDQALSTFQIASPNGTYTGGLLRTDSVSVREFTLAAPELSTWAMMLVGIGLVGAHLRSARRPSRRTTQLLG